MFVTCCACITLSRSRTKVDSAWADVTARCAFLDSNISLCSSAALSFRSRELFENESCSCCCSETTTCLRLLIWCSYCARSVATGCCATRSGLADRARKLLSVVIIGELSNCDMSVPLEGVRAANGTRVPPTTDDAVGGLPKLLTSSGTSRNVMSSSRSGDSMSSLSRDPGLLSRAYRPAGGRRRSHVTPMSRVSKDLSPASTEESVALVLSSIFGRCGRALSEDRRPFVLGDSSGEAPAVGAVGLPVIGLDFFVLSARPPSGTFKRFPSGKSAGLGVEGRRWRWSTILAMSVVVVRGVADSGGVPGITNLMSSEGSSDPFDDKDFSRGLFRTLFERSSSTSREVFFRGVRPPPFFSFACDVSKLFSLSFAACVCSSSVAFIAFISLHDIVV
eukprot:PhM_4_TR13983/c1_g2_i1/m.81617